jgi:TPR repeat protein
LIPVKWYISIMLVAGAVTFLYGIAIGDVKTILGSFLFSGIGGFAYFLYRRPQVQASSVPQEKMKKDVASRLITPIIAQEQEAPPIVPQAAPEPVLQDSSLTQSGDYLPLTPNSENAPNRVDPTNRKWLIVAGVVLTVCVIGTAIYAYSINSGSTSAQGISKNLLDEAKAGDAQAQTSIGRAYWQGTGVPKDYVQAVYWLRKAAEQGNPGAQIGLGIIYDGELEEVKGVPQDTEQAAIWYRKAAEQGNGIAEYLLGKLYSSGRGVPHDYAQAAAWYRKAAERGEMMLSAQAALGELYASGQGVPQDYTQALAWDRKAAEQGNAEAEMSLGWLYTQGKGVPRDYTQAASWFRKSAEQGNVDAQMRLGILNAYGIGVPRDYTQAAVWYRKAADQGNAYSEYQLGALYVNGQSVPQDYAQAAAWYRKAAQQGDTDAQAALGAFYGVGNGVPQSYVDAYYWLNLAVAGTKVENRDKLVEARDFAATKLTSLELSQAQSRATDWFVAHPQKP